MSTSPDVFRPADAVSVLGLDAIESTKAAVYAPIPSLRSGNGASAPQAPAPTAAGYAAGWAQGVAAAAIVERRTITRLEAAAAAQREDLLARTQATLAALDEAAAEMRQRTAPDVDATADALAAAAVELAEVVVGTHLEADPACGRAALARALAGAPEHAAVVVRMHPGDLSALSELDEQAALAGRRGVELVADPTLAAGDAVADFPGGSVDARVGTALTRMRSALRTGVRA